jgi:hypothetical protein
LAFGQSPDLNPIKHLWRDLKIARQRLSPSNLTELERICREEWETFHNNRCAKLVASYPKTLKFVIAAKRCFYKILSLYTFATFKKNYEITHGIM